MQNIALAKMAGRLEQPSKPQMMPGKQDGARDFSAPGPRNGAPGQHAVAPPVNSTRCGENAARIPKSAIPTRGGWDFGPPPLRNTPVDSPATGARVSRALSSCARSGNCGIAGAAETIPAADVTVGFGGLGVSSAGCALGIHIQDRGAIEYRRDFCDPARLGNKGEAVLEPPGIRRG